MQTNSFNPDDVAQEDAGIFGLSYSESEAKIVLLPAPWAVTVSYGGGADLGPEAIYKSSPQIDYYHEAYGAESWKLPVCMTPLVETRALHKRGKQLRAKAERHIAAISHGKKPNQKLLTEINIACEVFHEEIEEDAEYYLDGGKLVGLVGGDHSTPYGLIKALAKKHEAFGILQIDAHCDLRDAYEGFTYSHASIMWNVLKNVSQVEKLVQVGIRDYSPGERELIEKSSERIKTFFDADLAEARFSGVTWSEKVKEIVESLPQEVYISFDIDGLMPSLCPGTGTPVPGGLEFEQAVYLIKAVACSGKKIIGFDINEVAPQRDDKEWNANVGMRILWNLVQWSAYSQKISLAK
ncbi:MAG: hypothetical protein RI911_550 [Candidatus Parcubacteria bacterium]|jgi:agmatinase